MNMPSGFVFPKHSLMTDKVNRIMERLVDNGIVDRIFRQYKNTGNITDDCMTLMEL